VGHAEWRLDVNSGTTTRPPAFFAAIIAGIFLVIAPLSLATQWESSAQLKLLRIGLCFLGGISALLSGALRRSGGATPAILWFAFIYVLAATWSRYPLQGIAYKTLFLSSLCFGIAMGLSSPTSASLRQLMKWLGGIATVAAVVTWYEYLRNPAETTRLGRLAIYGINANAVGMTAGGYLFLTSYLAINDRGIWRLLGTLGTAILILLVVATGSRAALALAVLGGSLQLVPWIRRPARFLLPVAGVTLILLVWSAQLPVEATERLTDFEKNTRAGMWQAGIKLILTQPVFGHGWLSSSGRSTGNLQNLYLQTVAESGIFGAIALVIAGISISSTARRVHRTLPPEWAPQFWFALAIVIGLAVHGMAESALILGSTINTFLFGFGLGVLDFLSRIGTTQSRLVKTRTPEYQCVVIGHP